MAVRAMTSSFLRKTNQDPSQVPQALKPFYPNEINNHHHPPFASSFLFQGTDWAMGSGTQVLGHPRQGAKLLSFVSSYDGLYITGCMWNGMSDDQGDWRKVSRDKHHHAGVCLHPNFWKWWCAHDVCTPYAPKNTFFLPCFSPIEWNVGCP